MKVLIILGLLSTLKSSTIDEAITFFSSILSTNSFTFKESKTDNSFTINIDGQKQTIQGDIKLDQLTIVMTNSAITDTLIIDNLDFNDEKELLTEYVNDFARSCKDQLTGSKNILSLAKEAIIEANISQEITQQSFRDKESEFSFNPKPNDETDEVTVRIEEENLQIISNFSLETFSLQGFQREELKKQLFELFSDMFRNYPYLKGFAKGDSTIEVYDFVYDKLFSESSETEDELSPLDELKHIFKDISEQIEFDNSNEDLLVLKIGDNSVLNYSTIEEEELRIIKLELILEKEKPIIEFFPVVSTYKQEYLMRLFLANEVNDYLKHHPKLSEI